MLLQVRPRRKAATDLLSICRHFVKICHALALLTKTVVSGDTIAVRADDDRRSVEVLRDTHESLQAAPRQAIRMVGVPALARFEQIESWIYP